MKSFFITLATTFFLGGLFTQAQSITAVNPNAAMQGQALSVSITGQNTHFNQGSMTNFATLFRQGSPATQINASFTSASGTSNLSAFFNIPANAPGGYYDVQVSNTLDGNMSLPQSFFIAASSTARLIAVNPNTANQSQGLSVSITGQNTHFNQASGTNAVTLFMQGSPATQINATSSNAGSLTSLAAFFNIPANAPPGYYDVRVVNNIDGNLALLQSFFISAPSATPKLNAINPNNAKQGQQSLNVTITGQNTHFNQGSSTNTITLFRQGSPATIISPYLSAANSTTQLSASFNIPLTAPTGYYDVQVYNSVDGSLSLPQGFLINPGPTLITVNPNSAVQGQSLYVSITGQNTHFNQGSGSNIVKLKQGSSTTQLTAAFSTDNGSTSLYSYFNIPPAFPAGTYDVQVSNNMDGTIVLPQSFFISGSSTTGTTVITGINPSVGFQGQQSLNVTITGQNTHFTQGSTSVNTVVLVNHNIPSYSFNAFFRSGSNTTTILHAAFNIPAAAPIGIYDLQVSNSTDGTLTLPLGFLVTPDRRPGIIYINPASAELGQALTVDISGKFTNFKHGTNYVSLFKQGSPSITITGIAGTASSDSTLTGCAFNIPNQAATGYYDVVVSNVWDGVMTLPSGFYIGAGPSPSSPFITTVTPSYTVQNTNITVTIDANNTSFTQHTNTVFLSRTGSANISSSNVTTLNDGSLTAAFNIPSLAVVGYWDVNINSGGTLITKISGFEITKSVGVHELAAATSSKIGFYPNPFSENTLLTYDLAQASTVEISLYNITGSKLQTFVNSTQTTGHYELTLTAADIPGTGIYFISVKIGNENPKIIKAIRQ